MQSQELDATNANETVVGVSLGTDLVYTELHPDWDGTYYRDPKLFEDTRHRWELDHGRVVFAVFLQERLTSSFSAQARIGLTLFGKLSGGPGDYLPVIDILGEIEIFNSSFLRATLVSGFLIQRLAVRSVGGSRWISGIEAGGGIDLPYLPELEVIVQKPFVPLAYWRWESRNGGFVEPAIYHWSLRMGTEIPIWKIGN